MRARAITVLLVGAALAAAVPATPAQPRLRSCPRSNRPRRRSLEAASRPTSASTPPSRSPAGRCAASSTPRPTGCGSRPGSRHRRLPARSTRSRSLLAASKTTLRNGEAAPLCCSGKRPSAAPLRCRRSGPRPPCRSRRRMSASPSTTASAGGGSKAVLSGPLRPQSHAPRAKRASMTTLRRSSYPCQRSVPRPRYRSRRRIGRRLSQARAISTVGAPGAHEQGEDLLDGDACDVRDHASPPPCGAPAAAA